MHDIHSATSTLNARAVMSRRVLLAAGVAATLPAAAYGRAIVVSPQSPGPSAELEKQIAEYAAIVKEWEEISEKLDALYEFHPSQMVKVSEVMTNPNDYYAPWREEVWRALPDLVKAFNHHSHPLILVNEAAGKRIIADGVRAEALMRQRMDEVDQWVETSGLVLLEEKYDALWACQRALRDAICEFPCQSVEDIFAKVRFAKVYLHDIDSDYADELSNVLRSILPLATAGDHGSTREVLSHDGV